MNRANYYNYIQNKLMVLMYSVKLNGKLNLLDLNIHSENFFADLLNIIFNNNLSNMNAIKPNMESIDLKDDVNKIIVQVSSTCSKMKVEETLKKESLKDFQGLNYRIRFLFIIEDAKKVKGKSFKNPYNIIFDSTKDILDISVILKHIMNMKIDEQRLVYDFIKKELGQVEDISRVDSNLATIINILAEQDLGEIDGKIKLDEYNINRKIEFNNLNLVKDIIDDYKVYYGKVDEKYKEFDSQGNNKSLSVYQCIRKEYLKLVKNCQYNEDQIFLIVMDKLSEIVQNSKNYVEIPYEELDMCIGIIVVDAFIRCKIFKNPEGYSHVTT